MKVLHVFGGGVRSGVESYVLTLAEGMKDLGVETLLAPIRSGPFIKEARSLGFRVLPLSKLFRGDPFTVYRLRRLLKRERIDLVHTHAENGNLYGRLAAFATDVPVVSTAHTFYRETLRDRYSQSWMRELIYRQDLFTSRFTTKIIAVNLRITDALLEDGICPDKIVTVPNGVNIEKIDSLSTNAEKLRCSLKIESDAPVIGSVGRLSPVKSLETLIEAAPIIKKSYPMARFLIVGDGPRRASLEAQARRLGVSEQVIFTGWRSDVLPELSIMDIFVITSIIEGSSIAILEAMAMSKPVVATDVGGNPELVGDGANGFLFPYGDAGALASAVVKVLSDKEACERMGSHGRLRVEETFNTYVMVEKTAEIYKEILESAPLEGRT